MAWAFRDYVTECFFHRKMNFSTYRKELFSAAEKIFPDMESIFHMRKYFFSFGMYCIDVPKRAD